MVLWQHLKRKEENKLVGRGEQHKTGHNDSNHRHDRPLKP